MLAAAGLILGAVPAEAATFGPNLEAATANYQHTCGSAGRFQGCTVENPLVESMALVLPEPIADGNQTGIVTAIHVKSATEAPARFVVVEWSGRPRAGEPFPSGVMALSEQVTLHEGHQQLQHEGEEAKKPQTISYANGSFSIPAGKTLSVAVKLSKAGRTAVKGHDSLKAYANATLSGGQDKSSKITLKH